MYALCATLQTSGRSLGRQFRQSEHFCSQVVLKDGVYKQITCVFNPSSELFTNCDFGEITSLGLNFIIVQGREEYDLPHRIFMSIKMLIYVKCLEQCLAHSDCNQITV